VRSGDREIPPQPAQHRRGQGTPVNGRSGDHPSKPKSGLPGTSGDLLAREKCKVFLALEEAGS
jgi:hypothetical protein